MKVIVVSHGNFAQGLVDSVQMLVGEQENLVAYGLRPEQTNTDLRDELEEELKKTPKEEEVLFLTDLFHGTPFNMVVDLMRDYKFYHLTGINIPLTIEVMMGRYADSSAEEICQSVIEEAPDTVKYVNAMFENDNSVEDEEEE